MWPKVFAMTADTTVSERSGDLTGNKAILAVIRSGESSPSLLPQVTWWWVAVSSFLCYWRLRWGLLTSAHPHSEAASLVKERAGVTAAAWAEAGLELPGVREC